MDTITQEDISRQTEKELTSPLSPKRPRTDCTHDNSGKSSFDFPELLTFWKTIGSSSSTSTLQENAGLVAIAESGDVEDEKPHEQPQDALIVIPITTLTTSHTEDAGSSPICLIAAERCFKRLVGDERPQVTATDKLSSYLLDDDDDDDRALAETGSSKDASGDTSSHPDCKLLGKALEDEPPGGHALHAGNNEAGRPMRNSAGQIRALTGSSRDEGVRCQSDCSYEEALHDTGFYNTWSQSAEAGESNQEWEEHGFSENILFSEEKEEDNSLMSFTHADSDSFYSNSGNLAHGVKNEYKILELQSYENENVAVCNRETKEQVNENGMSMNSILSAALCAEGSIGSYDVVSARNIAIESVSLEADDFCGAKGDEAAGKMIAEARSETPDHTTETTVPAQISQGPAEGDNDASPFSVIDPAIWSETDREAKEKRCNSASAAAGVALLEMETPLPLRSDVPLSQEVSAPAQNGMKSNHQSGTQQRSDEKEDSWQSCTEPQASSINTEEAHNQAGGDGSCQWKSSPGSRPVEPPPAGDGRQDSHDTVGQEPDQSGGFPVSPDQLETKEVEYLQAEIGGMDGETEINEEEIRTGKQSENSTDFEQKEKHTEIIYTGDSISDLTESQISKYEDKLTHADDEWKDNPGLLSDHSYNVVILTTEGTAEEKESKEEASGEESDVHGNSELIVESEVDHQNDMPEESSEGNTSKSGHTITLASEPEQENKLSCFSEFQHRAEIFTGDNEVDPLAFPAFTFNGRTAVGFDTFERIQLSTDGEDGLSNSPLLTGLLGQLLKSPQQQLPHSMPEAESNEHEEVLEEEEEEVLEEQEEDMEVPEEQEEEDEEEERCGRHTENTAKGLSSSDTRCNEVPNFISAAADDIALGCESAYKSSERFQDDLNTQSASSTVPSLHGRPAPDANDSPKFEKRKLFDMVLKELNLFFDISTSEFTRDGRASSPERRVAVTEALEDALNHKEHLSSPKRGRYRDASSDDAGEDTSLEMCGGDPVVSCSSGGADGEQEVPLGQETSVCPAERHKETPEMEQKKKVWSPSFMCQPLLEQLSYRQPEQTRRLAPLKTCSRPIRVGLSKRAKTQRLHRLHPYK